MKFLLGAVLALSVLAAQGRPVFVTKDGHFTFQQIDTEGAAPLRRIGIVVQDDRTGATVFARGNYHPWDFDWMPLVESGGPLRFTLKSHLRGEVNDFIWRHTDGAQLSVALVAESADGRLLPRARLPEDPWEVLGLSPQSRKWRCGKLLRGGSGWPSFCK